MLADNPAHLLPDLPAGLEDPSYQADAKRVRSLTGHPGNLTKLARFFFLANLPHHHLHEGVAALGRHLAVFPFGHPPPGSESDYSALTLARLHHGDGAPAFKHASAIGRSSVRAVLGRREIAIQQVVITLSVGAFGWLDDLVECPFDVRDGYAVVPNRPGFGVTFRPETIDEFRFDG